MRILGGKDYYDSARAYGIDDDVVFVRANHVDTPATEHDFKTPLRFDYRQTDQSGRYRYYRTDRVHQREGPWIRPNYLWFCGKLYGGARITTLNSFRGYEYRYVWKQEILEQFMKENRLVFHERSGWRYAAADKYLTEIDSLFTPRDATKEEMDFLIDNRIAIGIFNHNDNWKHEWKFNTDGLKSVDFAKVIDPYQAFQELSMFVGGVIPRQPRDIVELSGEKIMLAKHGMDKWTFKKQGANSV